MLKKTTMNIRSKLTFLYKEAVRVNKLFEAISNKYKDQEISVYEKNLINKYYGTKKLNVWSDQDLATFMEGLPESWQDFIFILSNETEDQEYNEVSERLNGLIDTKLLSNTIVYKWMKSRYIDRDFNESHNPSDVISTVDKYVSIKDLIVNKLKSNNDFLEFFKTEGYNIDKVSDPLKLSYDDMIWIINQYETSGETSINTYNVAPKDGEYVARVGDWNVWLPHTQETSAKIAGYDELTKDPHTEWCTARTKGSNLFYNYISDEDNIKFLFYIIKDNPSDDNDWISLGFEEDAYDNMVLIADGEYGSDTVNRANEGLRDSELEDIFGSEDFNEILRICEEKMKSLGYKNPATEELYTYANNVSKLKKALWSRSYDERLEFIKIIQKLNPSNDVLIETVKFMDLRFIIDNASKNFIREHAPALGGLSPEDYIARKTAIEDPLMFFQYYSTGTKYNWFLKYTKIAFDSIIKKNLEEKLLRYNKILLNDHALKDRTRDIIISALKKKDKESIQIIFIQYAKFLEKENIDIIINFLKEESPGYIIELLLGMIDSNILESIFSNSELKNKVYEVRHEAFSNIQKIAPAAYFRYYDKIIKNDLFDSLNINKNFLEEKILIVANNFMDEDPVRFLHSLNKYKDNFNIVTQLIPEALKKVSETKPYEFFTFFVQLPESEGYIEDSIDKYLENYSPMGFLEKFHKNKEWFYKVADKVASAASKESPFLFLELYGRYSWAAKHVNYFSAAKDKPYEFILAYNNHLDKNLTNYAAKELVENSNIYSLIEFIKYCFLNIEDINLYVEYINIAFEKIIEKNLIDIKNLSFISNIIIKIKNTSFIEKLFGKHVRDLFYKIILFNKDSNTVYVNDTTYYNIINCILGVSNPDQYMVNELIKIINDNPIFFINSIKYRDDINKKVDQLGGKSWIEYAQDILLLNKESSNSIQNKLLKLSNFLKSNNLKEYNYLNYYIEE